MYQDKERFGDPNWEPDWNKMQSGPLTPFVAIILVVCLTILVFGPPVSIFWLKTEK